MIATLPATPALRRQQIKLQVALITPVIHIKGYSAPETKAAAEQARRLDRRGRSAWRGSGRPFADVFSSLWPLGDKPCGLQWRCYAGACHAVVTLAEKQGTTAARLVAHRSMGISLVYTGEFVEARKHLERTIALYDPAEHRPLATRFSDRFAVAPLMLSIVGPVVSRLARCRARDAEDAVMKRAKRPSRQLMIADLGSFTSLCGNYRRNRLTHELCALADEKRCPFWKINGSLNQGFLFVLRGDASNAIQKITSGITALRPMGFTLGMPWWLSHLAIAHADLEEIDDAWRCIDEATSTMKQHKERWFEGRSPIASPAKCLDVVQDGLSKSPNVFRARTCYCA